MLRPVKGLVGALLLTAVVAAPLQAAVQDDPDRVVACFHAYRTALQQGDGDSAVALVAPETVAFYAGYKDAALHLPEAELRQREPFDQFFILTYRMIFTAEELQAADAEAIMRKAVELEMVGEAASMNRITLDAIAFQGDRAMAAVLVDGTPAPFRFEFTRGSDCWLWDFMPILRMSQANLTQQIDAIARESFGGDRSAAVAAMIEAARGTPVEPRHWRPLAG